MWFVSLPRQATRLRPLVRELPTAGEPLGLVHLRGQISPASILQEQPAEVEVTYQALWDHQFFGIADGLVTSIHIAAVVPDRAGQFKLDVPDLHAQNLGEGEFQFILRAAKSGNIIAFLESADHGHDLAVLSSYPPLVSFVANRLLPVAPH